MDSKPSESKEIKTQTRSSDYWYHALIPINVKVAFESKVETRLFMTRHGTIVGPKGTETIVSVNDLAKTGWKEVWTIGFRCNSLCERSPR